MYDFESVINRRDTNSVKWDVKPNELPMWVADMDFRTAPEIIAAMQKKLELGTFGYETVGDDYFNAVADWYETEHHFRPQTDWMIFCTGVVPAISSMVRRLSHAGDNVVVQAPVYDIFYHSIENNGRHTLSNDLVYDRQARHYTIDFTDLEKKLADPLSTMMILCNPHNPVGKPWSRDELTKIAELCVANHVTLISDEIHGDLVMGTPAYTPLFSLPANLIQNAAVCVSTSKTFNLAALHSATVIVPNENLRESVSRGLNNDELCEPNLMAIPGTIAAYTQGHQWLAALKKQLVANREQVADFLHRELPSVKLVSENATYLLWLDVSQITENSGELATFIRQKTGLFLSPGDVYRGNGNQFLRLNIASPAKMVADGLNRLKKGIEAFK